MRIKSELWVKAYIRRCNGEAISAVVIRRGQSDGGAIFIKISTLDGNVALYGPAPAGLDVMHGDRHWIQCLGESSVREADADSYLQRQAQFDPDMWVIGVEDPNGRHFLGDALVEG